MNYTWFYFYNSLQSGAWLSWLERRVHIAEIAGSSPAAPIFLPTGIMPGITGSMFPTVSKVIGPEHEG